MPLNYWHGSTAMPRKIKSRTLPEFGQPLTATEFETLEVILGSSARHIARTPSAWPIESLTEHAYDVWELFWSLEPKQR